MKALRMAARVLFFLPNQAAAMASNVLTALVQIWANKVRSLLTVLGIIIAVTSIITVVSFVQGFDDEFKNDHARVSRPVSASICPSRSVTRRGAAREISVLCVISTTVLPDSCSSYMSAMISRDVAVSRLPVGSSARISAGSFASALAIAARWLSPPES